MNETDHKRVALVTGGARRVGRAIALELARAGFDVAIHYNKSALEAGQTADAIRSIGSGVTVVQADLAAPEAPHDIVSGTLEFFGRVDVLVNNASVFEDMSLAEFDDDAWHRTMHLNLAAPLKLCQLIRPTMEKQGAGCIINLCDSCTHSPLTGYLAYGPSKAGLDYATRALAKALAPEIRVNGVAPGIALFPEHYSPQRRQKLIDRVPLKRAGTPEDIARAVRFLAESPYITGQILNVDGGSSVA